METVRLGIDTGGTFTDFVVIRDGNIEIFKELSTPGHPEQAIMKGVKRIVSTPPKSVARSAGVVPPSEIIHGSTVATNALLERKGARTALLTTEGFEDVIVIGRQTRRDLYNIFVTRPEPLVPDGLRLGLRERTLHDGSIETALDLDHLRGLIQNLRRDGVESVAVSLLFSFANSTHENLVQEELGPLGVPISLSSKVLPEYREYERTSTTVINAYLAPIMSRYLHALQSQLAGCRLRVMQSNGGAVQAATAADAPVRTILSGPAGGVSGAFHMARVAGYSRIITFDMGGTSTDVSLCEDDIKVTHEAQVDGMPIGVPTMDIHTVGAGGGSIAHLDPGGALKVGPESAGADPGPICYGKGDRLTVTDANVILGRLLPRFFLGGTMQLQSERIEAALENMKWTQRWKTSEELAQGIIDVVNSNMAQAIRLISVERGYDPRDFTLFCFGGAGGLHAASLARDLGIRKVVVPRFPGALSALGLLLADGRKDYSRTLLMDAEASPSKWKRTLDELHRSGLAEMKKEGFKRAQIQFVDSVDLRYRGQSYELTIPLARDFIERFHRAHERRYGYASPGRPVELVNVRTTFWGRTSKPAFGKARKQRGRAPVLESRQIWIDGRRLRTTIYDRETLGYGHVIEGPAIIGEYSSTTLVPPGFGCQVDAHLNLVLEAWDGKKGTGHLIRTPELSDLSPFFPGFDAMRTNPVQLEIFKSLFHSIAEEMGATLKRTAFSPNIKERRDYSCAIFNQHGEMLAQGDHMPVHLGSMPLSVKAAIENRTIEPGDVVILNDPFHGGTHLPDVTLVSGVFSKRKLLFYVACRAHQSDIGGMAPGSMPLAEEIYQEGLRIPPIKLMSAGKLNTDVWDLVLLNVRTPEEREGDFRAMLGANRTGERRLQEIVEKYGWGEVNRYGVAILDYSERMTRHAISSIPNGTYQAEDFLDDDGISDKPIAIRIKVRIKDGSATIDFSDSDPQAEGSVNAVYAITASAVFYVFRTLVDIAIPSNAGGMRPLRVIAPEGTIVNARPPAAVCGGNVETSQRIVDVLYKCLAPAMPDRIPAASQGTMNNFTFGGVGVSPKKEPFAYYETVAGGMGARPTMDGLSGIHTHMTNSMNTPVEALENAYPVRVERYSLRSNSGGAGKWRGGDGVVKEVRFLTKAEVTVLSDRRRFAPYGLKGGDHGEPGLNVLIRKNGHREELASKFTTWVEAGDILSIQTPGGGGWGKP